MKLIEFINNNREELDSCINQVLNHVPRQASCNCHKSGTDHYHTDSNNLSYVDRREWILNLDYQ
jgi:hypothetical protein